MAEQAGDGFAEYIMKQENINAHLRNAPRDLAAKERAARIAAAELLFAARLYRVHLRETSRFGRWLMRLVIAHYVPSVARERFEYALEIYGDETAAPDQWKLEESIRKGCDF